MNKKFAICIGREFGSGGLKIAEELAKLLEINFYDKKLIELAAQKSGLCEEYFGKTEYGHAASVFPGDLSGRPVGIFSAGYYGETPLLNETLFKIQSDIIRRLSAKESCILAGRCADYVLRDHPRCLSVFICDDIDNRVKRIMSAKENESDFGKVKKEIEKTDKNRAKYYGFYTNKQWGKAVSYHLCLKSSVLGIEGSASYIRCFAREKFNLK